MSKSPFAQRRDGRTVALLYLYRWDITRPHDLGGDLTQFFHSLQSSEVAIIGEPDEVDFLKHFARPREYFSFGEELIQTSVLNVAEIDGYIRGFAHNWEFERIAKIDLAILRLAIGEMLYRKDIPPIVSINEAIDLSKRFSNADSKRFINGILDRLKDRLGRDARKAEPLEPREPR